MVDVVVNVGVLVVDVGVVVVDVVLIVDAVLKFVEETIKIHLPGMLTFDFNETLVILLVNESGYE